MPTSATVRSIIPSRGETPCQQTNGFRPNLIAILAQFFQRYRTAFNRPEPAITRVIVEVNVTIDGSRENAPAWLFNQISAIGRTEPIRRS